MSFSDSPSPPPNEKSTPRKRLKRLDCTIPPPPPPPPPPALTLAKKKSTEGFIKKRKDKVMDAEFDVIRLGTDRYRPSGRKIDRFQPLPKGYEWASDSGEPGAKDYVIQMDCIVCGMSKDHWPDDCPIKGTDVYNYNVRRLFTPSAPKP